MLFRTLVLCLFLLTTQLAKSQIIIGLLFGEKLNNDKLKFGLNVGANFGTLNNFNNTDGGLNFGLFLDIKLSDRFIISPEFYAINEIGSQKLSNYSVQDSTLDLALANTKVTRKLRYMSLPVLLKYRVIKQFYLSTGPQLSLISRAEDHFRQSLEEGDILFTRNIRDQVNPLDFGWIFGIGYTLLNGDGMSIEARFYQGLSQPFKPTDPLKMSAYNQYVQLTFSIPVGAKAKDDSAIKDSSN